MPFCSNCAKFDNMVVLRDEKIFICRDCWNIEYHINIEKLKDERTQKINKLIENMKSNPDLAYMLIAELCFNYIQQ